MFAAVFFAARFFAPRFFPETGLDASTGTILFLKSDEDGSVLTLDVG